MVRSCSAILLFLISGLAYGQSSLLENIRLQVDTLLFTADSSIQTRDGRNPLFFIYDNEQETMLINFTLTEDVDKISLMPSGDFELVDSLFRYGYDVELKIRFFDLTNTEFLKLRFVGEVGENQIIEEIPLQPVYQTFIEFDQSEYELYIGEEKAFRINTNNPDNLLLTRQWKRDHPINHLFFKSAGDWNLGVLPTSLGDQSLELKFPLKKPFLDAQGQLQYELPPIRLDFDVKESRLVFLQIDRDEVTPNDDKTEPVLIQIENHRALQIGKTYRIENQEEIGGPLIGELFTKSRLTNNRVLCEFRPYAFHRRSEGYLYIKDGDEPRFVTNLEITPKTQIQNIAIQRNGKDWENSNTIYPGENVNIRLTGVGLHKASFSFGGIRDIQTDSLIRNESMAMFNLNIPPDFQRKNIDIFNWNNTTGKSLQVKEFERARDFDFINLDLGQSKYTVSRIYRPIYHEGSLYDLIIGFDRSAIDRNNDFHGIQYVDFEFRVFNKEGSLLEIHRVSEYGVCPDNSSPRSEFYTASDCKSTDLNLNQFLNKKTYDLEEWSRIEISLNHSKGKYKSGSQQKKITIYLKRSYNFDIDVSFPAGLLILKKGDTDAEGKRQITNFSGGISFAMIAQFSFYQEGKIAKYKPFKLGAGFIAIDALNFSENSDNRDVALVALGSLYPISSNRKLTFPLYTGFGYLLQESKFFFLVGPGIRVRL